MISNHYRALNEQAHKDKPQYGTGQKASVTAVKQLCDQVGSMDVLDYGCGKGGFSKNFKDAYGVLVQNYDPCVPEYSLKPQPSDVVICVAVLEHIEPQFIDEVLDHLKSLTRKVAWFQIDLCDNSWNFPDGTNPHQIIKPSAWWIEKLARRFDIVQVAFQVKPLPDFDKVSVNIVLTPKAS